MAHPITGTKNLGGRLAQPEGRAASLITSWYREERELLSKEIDNTPMKLVEESVVLPKVGRSEPAKKAGRDLSSPNSPLEDAGDPKNRSHGQKPSQVRPVVVTSDWQGICKKGAEGKQLCAPRKSMLPAPGSFVYEKNTNKVKTVRLVGEDYAWLKEAGKLVCLAQPTVHSAWAAEDEEQLRLQTQVLLYGFLRSHCHDDPRRVCTPAWILTRLFQCYCLAANVPVAEVVDSVVAGHIEKYLVEKYECTLIKGRVCVLGVGVYNDSPLHTLWASTAVIVEDRKKPNKAPTKRTKNAFTRCVLVHPHEAMSSIRLFTTDAGEKSTTGKFVVRAVARKLQQEYCCDARELNRMEFGHVMCKGNRGIKTARPQCRIMPSNRKAKQEYQYARVMQRPTPLLTRNDLGAAIQRRGFRLPRRQILHLMRNAKLHTSYSSGKDGDTFH